MAVTPRDNGIPLDQFNNQLRTSPVWVNFMRRNGFDVVGRPGLVPRLSDSQRKQLQRELQATGVQFVKGMEVDPAGNVNQDQKLGKKIAIGAAIAGAAVTGLGAAGVGPLAGAFGGGAAASGGLSGLYSAPAAIASQGVAAGAGTGASMAGGGLFSTLGKFFGSPGGSMLVDAAGNLIGAGLQSRAANRASDVQSRYNQQALEFLKQQDARDYAEYLAERERDWRIQDEDRGRRIRFEDERETRLAPFRQNASQGYQTLSSLLFNSSQQLPRAASVGPARTSAAAANDPRLRPALPPGTRRFADLLR